MLANADLPEYEDEFEVYEPKQSFQKPPPYKKPAAAVMDDEDRYLEEILQRNYNTSKAPPAVQ